MATSDNAAGNVDLLLKRVSIFLEDGDWGKADEYCERVLDQDPENSAAYVGKLMAELQVRRKEDLQNCPMPFDGNKNYRNAVRFGDTDLPEYTRLINERNAAARVESVYIYAVGMMRQAKTESEYRSAAEYFRQIPGYKDADVLAAKCWERIEFCRREQLAREAALRMEKERKAEERRITRQKMKKTWIGILSVVLAVAAFTTIGVALFTKILPDKRYNDAIALRKDGKYDEAITAFEKLNGYKNSKSEIKRCKFLSQEETLDDVRPGDVVRFGEYEQDGSREDGKEEIEWLVLDVKVDVEGAKALVISKYALDCRSFGNSLSEHTWDVSAIEDWLNDDFYKNAFSSRHQDRIVNQRISAGDNPQYDTDPGESTVGSVFLLSIEEAEQCFGSDAARQCSPTLYAVEHGAYKNQETGNCWWWLRSPGCDETGAAGVRDDGSISYKGIDIMDNVDAVRPAMWIELK